MKGLARWLKTTSVVFCFLFSVVWSNVITGEVEDSNAVGDFQVPRVHLHHLGSCRRQLTFLASLALGAFITRVIKESPMTPLPMPPLPNSLHWNLVRVPAHLAGHVAQWVEKHPAGRPVILNQGFAGLARSSSDDPWTNNLLRIRKDLTKQLRNSPNLILSAVERTLKPLKLIPHAIGMHHWLLRLCP
ncbi:uncharacterized protein LOC129968148 [Argiope bruennichi]|uniref:Uncharacterized protein n=1 Tax=Argiope bruennichi TaxID=94029 RepID=A0A8T0FPW2_ARGBR|nr:uncharacterized protein LOC129968148 [Argiope bruennichi]KAF8792375.1 hypothetical protein HNY73_003978 [Argiope bruennichi]